MQSTGYCIKGGREPLGIGGVGNPGLIKWIYD